MKYIDLIIIAECARSLFSAHRKHAYNKAFKSDSQRLAVSLRSSIAKRHSHLNAALYKLENVVEYRNYKCFNSITGCSSRSGCLVSHC
ncbi:hypothetical protein CGI88_18560 [Vibrio parahaemolyticus]|nr:hypothetical protein CGI88_18560 [Vibrio parahaemolyticus]TOK95747.1 hypothetical protein CGI06_21720 [Vibrio parahaemolyticus]TOP89889.1 hypothetical protein CGH07_16515 [Vibrio parahaemolyticus]